MDDDEQLARFRQAVDDKNEESEARSETEEQPELADDARPPDTRDPRAKSSGRGKKTADKWNQ